MKMNEKDMTTWWIGLALSVGCRIDGGREVLLTRNGVVLGRGEHSRDDAALVHAVAQFVTGGGDVALHRCHLECRDYSGPCRLASGDYGFPELCAWMDVEGSPARPSPRYAIERDGDLIRVTLSDGRPVVTPFHQDDEAYRTLYEQVRRIGHYDWQDRGFTYRSILNKRGQLEHAVVSSPKPDGFEKLPFSFRVAKTGAGPDFRAALAVAFAAPETEIALLRH